MAVRLLGRRIGDSIWKETKENRQIDVLKIDLEGAEMLVFQRMQATLDTQPPPRIVCGQFRRVLGIRFYAYWMITGLLKNINRVPFEANFVMALVSKSKRFLNRLLSRIGYCIKTLPPDPFRIQCTYLQKKERPIIFDVGVHVGRMSKRYLKINPCGLVYAFEPAP